MKIEQLKLYQKYKNINNPNKELIFIGLYNNIAYIFLHKNTLSISFNNLKSHQLFLNLCLKTTKGIRLILVPLW
jgi:hypothetical protein